MLLMSGGRERQGSFDLIESRLSSHGLVLVCAPRAVAERKLDLEPSSARSWGAVLHGACTVHSACPPTLFISLICLICLARIGTEFAALVLKACPFCGLEYILLTLPTYYSDTIFCVCFQGFSSALEFISKEMGASSEFLASNLVSESEVAVHS